MVLWKFNFTIDTTRNMRRKSKYWKWRYFVSFQPRNHFVRYLMVRKSNIKIPKYCLRDFLFVLLKVKQGNKSYLVVFWTQYTLEILHDANYSLKKAVTCSFSSIKLLFLAGLVDIFSLKSLIVYSFSYS